MHRTLLLATLATVIALGATPIVWANHGTTVSKTYLLAGENTFLNSCSSNSGIGGVRFCGVDNPPPQTVKVTIADSTGLRTGGLFCFSNTSSGICLTQIVCGNATFAVPTDPVPAEIWITVSHESVAGGCVSLGGVSGTVTLTWSTT